jgi:hypothetical protein
MMRDILIAFGAPDPLWRALILVGIAVVSHLVVAGAQ